MRFVRLLVVAGLVGAVGAAPSPVAAQQSPPSCIAGSSVASSPVYWTRNLPRLAGPGYNYPDLGTLVASGDNVLWWVDQRVFEADGFLNYESEALRRLDLASGEVTGPYAGEISYAQTRGGGSPQRDAGLFPTGDGGLVLVNQIYVGAPGYTVSIEITRFDALGQITNTRTFPAFPAGGQRKDIVDAAYDSAGQRLYAVIVTRAADGSTSSETLAYDASSGFSDLWSVPGGSLVESVDGGAVVLGGSSAALSKIDGSGTVVWGTGVRSDLIRAHVAVPCVFDVRTHRDFVRDVA